MPIVEDVKNEVNLFGRITKTPYDVTFIAGLDQTE